MYSTPQLIAGITNEFNILKHLGSKVSEANHAHKLTDPQRSIQELEHYIISSLPAQIIMMVEWVQDNQKYMDYSGQFADFSYDQFDAELDRALTIISDELLSLTESQWSEEISIWGRTGSRSMFLIDYVFAFLGAYKMQLFLQLKHSGLSDLGTMNLWAGVDAK
jgi:hypothetical protein